MSFAERQAARELRQIRRLLEQALRDAARGSVPSPTPESAKGVSSPPVLNDLGPEAGAKAG